MVFTARYRPIELGGGHGWQSNKPKARIATSDPLLSIIVDHYKWYAVERGGIRGYFELRWWYHIRKLSSHWKKLPTNIHHFSSITDFKCAWNTYLFQKSYNNKFWWIPAHYKCFFILLLLFLLRSVNKRSSVVSGSQHKLYILMKFRQKKVLFLNISCDDIKLFVLVYMFSLNQDILNI